VWQVVVYGGASAMLWNALLFALGWLAGESFEVLEGWVARYALVAVVIALSVLALFVWRRRRRPL
jgi:membrane protein DedA with SNARE-associated domain